MPPQLEARRSERIDYRAEVELLARSTAAALPHSVVAHALDLGPGGMRIATESLMPIGAEVTCRMTLDGRPAAFPGRVVWRREPSANEASNAHGMGICFESLGAYESGLLRHVVERSSAGYRPVELHFAGIEHPVVARARAHADGLRLSAALPIFARGTELSFQLDEEGPHFTGHIGNAVLLEEHGARRIEIDVDVGGDVARDAFGENDPVRFRRRARYGYPAEIEAEERQELEASRGSASTRAVTAPALASPDRQANASGTQWLPMFVAALVGGTLAWSAASRFAAPAAPLAQAEFIARPLPIEPPPIEPLPIEPLPRAAEPEPQPTLVEAQQSTSEPVTAATEEPVTAESQASELGTADAQPPSHTPRLPESLVEANTTRIRIPFDGDLTGMRSTIWADPAALAIELPHGATSLEPGRYPIGQGGVTDLRVNRNARSLLVRMRLSVPIARYTIATENGVLEAQLQRARASRAAH